VVLPTLRWRELAIASRVEAHGSLVE